MLISDSAFIKYSLLFLAVLQYNSLVRCEVKLSHKSLFMKKGKPIVPSGPRKLIQINNYTWIEKRADVPDEIARQKFLLKLPKVEDSKDFIAGIQ